MALIMHRCTKPKCGHPDYYGSRVTDTGKRACCCGCQCTPGPPEVAPTFDQTGAVMQRIAEPGKRLNDTTNITPCGCKDCKALQAQPATPEPRGTAQPSPRMFRKWAAETGVECPQRGPIPQQVIEAYNAVHA